MKKLAKLSAREEPGLGIEVKKICNEVELIRPTFSLPSNKPGTLGFGSLKCKLAGIARSFIAMRTFAKEARPAVGSECPMLDLTEPTSSGLDRPLLQNTSVTPFISCGSPTAVPVLWSSTYGTDAGSTPASAYNSRISLFCLSFDGKVTPVNADQSAVT